MKDENINALLEKYFEGTSSLQEENMLRHYFLFEDISEDLLPYKAIFQSFEKENKLIFDKFDESTIFKSKDSITLKNNSIWAIAASIIILFGSLFLMKSHKNQVIIPSQSELLIAQKYLTIGFESFDKAYTQSQKVLNKTQVLNHQTQKVEKMGIIYQNNIKNIANLNYIDRSLNQLQNISSIRKSKLKLIM